MQWDRLWAALEAIPEEEAIGEEEPKREGVRGPAISLSVKQSAMRNRRKLWQGKMKTSVFRSAFCNQKECRFCKQDDSECPCHTPLGTS